MKESDKSQLIRKIKEEKLYRLKYEKYRYYTPIGKVEEFINLIASNKYIVTLISAANGIGKTVAGVNLLANIIWPCGNNYFNHDLFKNWPYPKRIRIVSDPTVITDNIIPTMKEYFPRGRYPTTPKYTTKKDNKAYESHWHTNNGWDITLMTYEQDLTEFEGATLGLVWFDEPPLEPIYKACIARLRAGGLSFITATPLSGSAWMYDDIIVNANNEEGYRAFIQAEVEDACIEHGVRGFLKHENIERMIAQYDPDDVQARVFGKFQHLTGLIYKNFNLQLHSINPFEITKKDFIVVELFDCHPRNPDAVSWIAIDRKNRKFIVDELYGSYETPELVQRIKEKSSNYRIIKRLIDPSAFNVDQHKEAIENSLAKVLQKHGLYYFPASKRRADGIRLTRNELNYQIVGRHVIVPPNLYVFETCQRHIYEFTHWQWEDWRGKVKEYKNLKEKPMDRDDHMMENVGRALLENITFVEMPKEEHVSTLINVDPYY